MSDSRSSLVRVVTLQNFLKRQLAPFFFDATLLPPVSDEKKREENHSASSSNVSTVSHSSEVSDVKSSVQTTVTLSSPQALRAVITPSINTLACVNRELSALFKQDLTDLKKRAARKLIQHVSVGNLQRIRYLCELEAVAVQKRKALENKNDHRDEKHVGPNEFSNSIIIKQTFVNRRRTFTLSPIQWAAWNLDGDAVAIMCEFLTPDERLIAMQQLQELKKGVVYTLSQTGSKDVQITEPCFNIQGFLQLYDNYILNSSNNNWGLIGLGQYYSPAVALAAFTGPMAFYPKRLLPLKLQEPRCLLLSLDGDSIFTVIERVGRNMVLFRGANDALQFTQDRPSAIAVSMDMDVLKAVFEMQIERIAALEKNGLVPIVTVLPQSQQICTIL